MCYFEGLIAWENRSFKGGRDINMIKVHKHVEIRLHTHPDLSILKLFFYASLATSGTKKSKIKINLRVTYFEATEDSSMIVNKR